MRKHALIAAMTAMAFSYDQVISSWVDTPKTKTGYPTDSDFARMDKAQAKRDRRAKRNLRSLK